MGGLSLRPLPHHHGRHRVLEKILYQVIGADATVVLMVPEPDDCCGASPNLTLMFLQSLPGLEAQPLDPSVSLGQGSRPRRVATGMEARTRAAAAVSGVPARSLGTAWWA
ncbi:uncharacterized protein LOC125536336 [Triticum urartu]|uniref:uncharacterized protein LOC125536336 n=1 Tax=Triticum urartu TaxID=4572 RepID=UPI002044BE79|nr:uncharacterized protein LOC125536336 [Triticum urartu]